MWRSSHGWCQMLSDFPFSRGCLVLRKRQSLIAPWWMSAFSGIEHDICFHQFPEQNSLWSCFSQKAYSTDTWWLGLNIALLLMLFYTIIKTNFIHVEVNIKCTQNLKGVRLFYSRFRLRAPPSINAHHSGSVDDEHVSIPRNYRANKCKKQSPVM